MTKKFIVLLACLQALMKMALGQPCKEVIGYYPNWQWYDRSNLVNPKSIDYSKYTILNYSFFKPLPDGSIAQTDSWADENILKGDHDWNLGGYKPNTSLIDLAHKNGVKVMVSIGGWTLSNDFPTIAADPVARQKFADECVRLLKEFNFDGIDIDWEYPGYPDHQGTVSDKHNFTLLLQAIRSAIDARGSTNGTSYLLSACFSADPNRAADIEWDVVKKTLNMINLMTYDFFGAWETISNHNSPLYAPAQGNPAFNTNSAFKMLTEKYNIPSDQINLGVAFYGRSFANCKGLFGSHTGPDTQLYSEDDGSPLYYNIMKKFDTFTRYWDDQAKVPYAIGGTASTFISYDDEESIGMKADYIVKNKARGCIIWEITGDYIETGGAVITPLASKIKEVFCGAPTMVSNKEEVQVGEFSIHPNPVSDVVFIEVPMSYSVKIVSMTGQLVFESHKVSNVQVDFHGLAAGTYLCLISNKEGETVGKKLLVHY